MACHRPPMASRSSRNPALPVRRQSSVSSRLATSIRISTMGLAAKPGTARSAEMFDSSDQIMRQAGRKRASLFFKHRRPPGGGWHNSHILLHHPGNLFLKCFHSFFRPAQPIKLTKPSHQSYSARPHAFARPSQVPS